jgi:flagellar assembly factor FliW
MKHHDSLAEFAIRPADRQKSGPVRMEDKVVNGCGTIRSKWLGEVALDPDCELYFPSGLPGFEDERRFVPVEIPAQRPLVYLQSVINADICFVSLPVFVIKRDFDLHISEDERCELQLPEMMQPRIGEDVLCLALLLPSGETVEANLNAAIVINLHNRRGIQCIPSVQSSASFRLSKNGSWATSC